MKKVYLDMDGVLADFGGQPNALNRFTVESGFFEKLAPTSLVELVNKMLNNPIARENLFILSASPNLQADNDKMAWLEKHLPNFKKSNIIIIRGGTGANERKAQYANDDAYLIDDYSENLLTWERNGGRGIKLLNGRNGKGETWKGNSLKLDTLLK